MNSKHRNTQALQGIVPVKEVEKARDLPAKVEPTIATTAAVTAAVATLPHTNTKSNRQIFLLSNVGNILKFFSILFKLIFK